MSMRYTLETEEHDGKRDNEMSMTLLSDKSIEKLHDLRDFNFTQRYFTIDGKANHKKSNTERNV